jgi:hypothetical protein
MASQAQIDAHRRNVQKSCGPRTEVGKARARLNALKDGTHAKIISPVLPHAGLCAGLWGQIEFQVNLNLDLTPRGTKRLLARGYLSEVTCRGELGDWEEIEMEGYQISKSWLTRKLDSGDPEWPWSVEQLHPDFDQGKQ